MVRNPYKCLWFLESIPQNHTNSYFFSYNFCDVHKISQHSDFLLGFFQIVNEWPDFTAATKMQHVFKSLDAFWLLCQEVETFVWILKHVLRSIPWSLFNVKELTLVKWSITTWSFTWWCQIINRLNIQYLKFSPVPWTTSKWPIYLGFKDAHHYFNLLYFAGQIC